MEQHAVPRQITTFEFKLIGFFTIKQFVYLMTAGGFAIVVYFIIPIPLINILLAILVLSAGAVFSIFRYNERELDVWIKNLLAALLSPSQYNYSKHNAAPDFLKGIYVSGDDHLVQTHIDSNQKLAKYIGRMPTSKEEIERKQKIITMLHQQSSSVVQKPTTQETESSTTSNEASDTLPQGPNQAISISTNKYQENQDPSQSAEATTPIARFRKELPDTNASAQTSPKKEHANNITPDQTSPKNSASNTPTNSNSLEIPKPFLSGVIHNSKNEPLPNIMVYINSSSGKAERILKTNHHGLFATFHSLPEGDYSINPKDLGGKYFFDTMNITINEQPPEPLEIYSKEVL